MNGLSPVTLAGAVVCLTAVAAALLMVRNRVAVGAGSLLGSAGALGLVACWLTATSSDQTAAVAAVLAGMVLAPAAYWAYPRLPRHPAELVLGALLVAPGLAGLADSLDGGFVGTMALGTGSLLLLLSWWRLERAHGAERWPPLWAGLALVCSALAGLALVFVTSANAAATALAVALLAAVPVAMWWEWSAPELVDVRALAVQAVVGAVVAIGYVAYVVGVVTALALAGRTEPSRGVAAVVGLTGAVAVAPAVVVLRGVVDRLLLGDRPDPLRTATTMAGRVGRPGRPPRGGPRLPCPALRRAPGRRPGDRQLRRADDADAFGAARPGRRDDGCARRRVAGRRPRPVALRPGGAAPGRAAGVPHGPGDRTGGRPRRVPSAGRGDGGGGASSAAARPA